MRDSFPNTVFAAGSQYLEFLVRIDGKHRLHVVIFAKIDTVDRFSVSVPDLYPFDHVFAFLGVFRIVLPHRDPYHVVFDRIPGNVARFDFREVRRIFDFDDRFLDLDKNILGSPALRTGEQAVVRGSERGSGRDSGFGKAQTGIIEIMADGADSF
jgi:hypothetical protein